MLLTGENGSTGIKAVKFNPSNVRSINMPVAPRRKYTQSRF